MFKELYETSTKLSPEFLARKPSYFLPKIVEQALSNQNQGGVKQQADKIIQAKRAFMSLLDALNAKFAGELKKDQEKMVTFLYSKFSPVESCLKKEKVLLKDMLGLVQTNLLKLYVDLKEKDKIYQFF